MEKLYLVKVKAWFGKVECEISEVEVVKETDKQYQVSGCSRARVNKSELDTNVGFSDIEIFTLDADKALKMAQEITERKVDDLQKNLEVQQSLLEKVKEVQNARN